jgi:hypothetical protein
MTGALLRVDQFLRGAGDFHPAARARRPWWWLPLMILCFAALYGGFMGSFHYVSAARAWQVFYSAIKVPFLLIATSLLCLPGFFVINTLLGLRDDLRESLQAIFAGQAGLSIVLAALAPMTRFWYFSSESYRSALLFNAAMFTVATLAGHLVSARYYKVLIARHRYHRIAHYAWLITYALVGIQMGWTLRPFVGSPDIPTSFFRDEPFSNAYIVIVQLVFGS